VIFNKSGFEKKEYLPDNIQQPAAWTVRNLTFYYVALTF
jgi:hypothetical protein